MDQKTFEQIEIPDEKLSNEKDFLTEGLEVIVISYKGIILGLEIPKNVTLKVTETADSVRGDTVGNATKKAKLEKNAPQEDKKEVTELAPGIGTTSKLSCFILFIVICPGSEIQGVPASEIIATSPFNKKDLIVSNFSFSLKELSEEYLVFIP